MLNKFELSSRYACSDGRTSSSRRKAVLEARQVRQSAALNKETSQTVIPRTSRMDSRQCQPVNPDQFAAILIAKLENVKREQESEALLEKTLKEVYKSHIFKVGINTLLHMLLKKNPLFIVLCFSMLMKRVHMTCCPDDHILKIESMCFTRTVFVLFTPKFTMFFNVFRMKS